MTLFEEIREKYKQLLFDEFSIVGEFEEDDIEFFFDAQNEVILDEKY